MEQYDWINKSLYCDGKTWVYYFVVSKSDKKRVLVKLDYDRNYDWEFEH